MSRAQLVGQSARLAKARIGDKAQEDKKAQIDKRAQAGENDG